VYHVSKYAQSYGGGVFSGKKKFYEDANQTENFIGTKTGNDLYYRVKNIINPTFFYIFSFDTVQNINKIFFWIAIDVFSSLIPKTNIIQ